MTRTRILTFAALAVLAAGATTAGAAAYADDPDDTTKSQVRPLAAHGQYEGAPTTVPAGGQANVGVNCPAGQVPTGGGAKTSAFDIYLTDSFPAGTGWTVIGKNIGNSPQTLRAVVVCTVP
ncbi:hypothetical protein [Streptomyces cadmiisoli]|uniref:hypothetical protein n=1 Tax=Streptomyces cadmiisoli TaxID=2184053 RepID=UPI003662A015